MEHFPMQDEAPDSKTATPNSLPKTNGKDDFDKKLARLVPDFGYEFTGDAFRDLCRPLVYLFLGRNDEPLYVGMTGTGIGRPANLRHHVSNARNHCYRVLIYPCKDVKAALKLELFLIRRLRPEYNIKNQPTVRNANRKPDIERASGKAKDNSASTEGRLDFLIDDSLGHTNITTIDRTFFRVWSDSFGYVLGFIYASGNLLKSHYSIKRKEVVDIFQINIYWKAPSILKRIRETISLNKPIARQRINRKHIYRLSFRDREIFARLESFGLCPKENQVLGFPEVPPQYINGFVRGLFDGCGSFYDGQARLTIRSEEFSNGLQAALASVGFASKISMTPISETRTTRTYTLNLSNADNDLEKFYLFLYTGAKLFMLKNREAFEENLSGIKPTRLNKKHTK